MAIPPTAKAVGILATHFMKKRGMLETQLKFIFIGIAGALILLLIFSFVQKQNNVSSQELAEKISRTIGNALSMAQTTEETKQAINLPQKLKIQFDCEAGTATIGGTSKKMPSYTIFAPEQTEDYSIITKTRPLQLPFTITNLLYLAPTNIRYLIVYDDANTAAAEQLYNELPAPNKEMAKETEQLQNKNHQATKIILLTANTDYYNNLPEQIKNSELKIIKAQKETATQAGEITFYSPQLTEEGKAKYTTETMLIAAASAENYAQYACAMNNALERMPAIAETNIKKVNRIMQNTARCRTNYQKHAIEPLNKLKEAAESKDIQKIKENSQKVKQENELLEALSCPTIY